MRGLLRFLARRHEPVAVFVDVDEPARKRLIHEAEYQQELDRYSQVMRVSGKRKWPVVARRGLVEVVRATKI